MTMLLPIDRDGICRRIGQAGLALAIVSVFPICHAVTNLLMRDAFPLCPFRIATGKPCPLCGATRAIALASHGRFAVAFAMNPGWPVFAAGMFSFSILLMIDAATGSDQCSRALRYVGRNWMVFFIALCVFDVWRIAWPPFIGHL